MNDTGLPRGTPALAEILGLFFERYGIARRTWATWVLALAFLISALISASAIGQQLPNITTRTSAISGMVTGPAGTAIMGAEVVLRDEAGFKRETETDEKGQYAFRDLPGRTFTLTITAPNFAVQTFDHVRLASGSAITLDASLTPTVAKSEIEVAGNAPPQQATGAAAQQQATVATGTAGVSGTVTDPSQAVITGAEVVLSGQAGYKRETKTDDKGVYAFRGLPGGTYTLTITAPNFAVRTFDYITLAPGGAITMDASLVPAVAKSELSVEGGNVGQVEVETATVSGTITQKQVTTIGLNGRNFTQLIALTAAPGVSNQTGQDEAKVGVVGSVKYSVNGGRVEYNTFEVDGSDVLNTGLNGSSSTLMVYPSIDAIQEVKVLTSNYSAQYGRTASGTVLVTTKSGTKDLHGNLYEFVRNEIFNARNYFDVGRSAPLYRRNDFGGTIGGPLTIPGVFNKKKDKTFFFFSEEVRLEKTPTEYNQAVPSLKERGLIMTPNGIQPNLVNVNGQSFQMFDFSDVCPLAGSLNADGTFSRQRYPDCPSLSMLNGNPQPIFGLYPYGLNAIPDFMVNKNAVAILNSNLIPLPNSPTGCNYSVANIDPTDPNHCYDATISAPTYWREELFRIDHNFSSNTKLSFRYVHDAWNTTTLVPQWSYQHQNYPSVGTFPTVQNQFDGPGLSLVTSLTKIISPTMVNNLVLSYVNSTITLVNQNGPGGAQYQLNPSLYQPLVVDPANPGVCNPLISTQPPYGGETAIPQCGLGYIFNNGFAGKIPSVAILGTNAAYGGEGFAYDTSYMPWGHTNPTYSVRDDVSKSVGKHTLTFGALYVYSQRNQTNNVIGAASGEQQGLLTFSNLAHSSGNAFADFLTEYVSGCSNGVSCGFIQSYTQDSAQQRYYQRYQIAEPYFQDDWKVTRRLTLNLGLRLSLFGTYSEKSNNVWNWVPSRFNPAAFAVDPVYGVLLDKSTNTPIPAEPLTSGVLADLGLVRCGVNGTPSSCMQGHLFNFAPRVGFAWDPKGDGKTSIRAGYGVFYEHGTGNEANTGSLEASAPLVLSMTQPNPVNYMCIGNVGYGGGNNGVACSNAGYPVPPADSAYPPDVTAIPTQAHWPYVQQWSFGAQRELAKGLMLDVAYVGSKGTHLTIARQLNQALPLPLSENPFSPNEPLTIADCTSWNGGPGGAINPRFLLENGAVVTAQNAAYPYLEAACAGVPGLPNVNSLPTRPYPGLGKIYSLENVANSNYNALQLKLQHTTGDLTGQLLYSYSHSIDDSSDRSDPVLVNSYDLRSNRASSDFDQRHLVTLNLLYTIRGAKLKSFFSMFAHCWPLPYCEQDDQQSPQVKPQSPQVKPDPPTVFGRLRHFFFSDGWQISALTVYQAGTPFSVINSAGNTGISLTDNAGVSSGLGLAESFPDLSRSGACLPTPPNSNTAQNIGPLLGNPCQYVAPRGLTFGDAGRNDLNNPSRFNVDMSLLKDTKLSERLVMQFRAEVFNVFNNTQFRIFDLNNPGSSGNNIISCYAGPQYSAGFWAPGGPNCVSGSSFLHPVDAHRPRTMQFGLKLGF